MRNSNWTVAALLAAVLLLGVGLVAQTTESARAMLRTAMDTAVVDGDLRAAITQFQTIVETFKTDDAIVATALVRMGGLFEKLGEPKAHEVYDRVLRDYPDQAAPVAAARAGILVGDTIIELEGAPLGDRRVKDVLVKKPKHSFTLLRPK